jgi:3-oxoacyl-[acyl-carrier-protein] synthase II
MRRVVITGMGAVTPLASNLALSWERLLAGKSGLAKITRFDASAMPCQIAGEVKFGEGEGEFNPDNYIPKKDQKKMDNFIQYGVAAAHEAITDAGWTPTDEASLKRTGVMIGSGIGGLAGIEEAAKIYFEQGPRRLSPFFIPAVLINLVSGHVSMKYGFRGPNHSVVTACATGGHAIGDASRLIMFGDADVMIAGGTEAAVCGLGIGGFCAARALSTSFNDAPEKGSRPWDKNRDGFVMGEGAGVVVLEEYEHAKARGAKIYAEVVGYGLSGDAHHITAPHEEGRGGFDAMEAALRNAKITPNEIDYINAHGTSTPLGDMIEFKAVKRLLGEHASNVSMSSTKSSIGHLLGGAGAVEAVFTAMAIHTQTAPATLNLDEPQEGTEGIDLVPHTPRKRKIDVALSNSFGFGGTNVSLVLKKL